VIGENAVQIKNEKFKMMKQKIRVILFDLSWTLLFPKQDGYRGALNNLYQKIYSPKQFSFWDNYELNQSIMNWIRDHNQIIDCYILTSGSIQKDPELSKALQPLFKQIFICMQFGLSKSDPKLYLQVAKRIECKSNEIFFVDDQERNVEAAKGAGCEGMVYEESRMLLHTLDNLLYGQVPPKAGRRDLSLHK
jgi:HAD superfamily hydrolase (TIGR01549 family)